MKASCLECMRYIFPDGVANQHQHRDVIRCFMMGWVEAMQNSQNSAAVTQFVSEFSHTADLNWWPDESWKWW
jgi:hypothetical protein